MPRITRSIPHDRNLDDPLLSLWCLDSVRPAAVGMSVLLQELGAMTPAEQIRREWLRLMGMAEEEIEANVREFPPVDEAIEQQELDAARRIERRT